MGIFRVWQSMDSWGIINYQAGGGADEDGDGVPIKLQPAADVSSGTLATLPETTLASVKLEAHSAVVATCNLTPCLMHHDTHTNVHAYYHTVHVRLTDTKSTMFVSNRWAFVDRPAKPSQGPGCRLK